MGRTREGLSSMALLLVLLAVWETIVHLAAIPAFVLPPPSRVLLTLISEHATIANHAAATLTAVALGLAIGLAAGLGMALTSFYLRPLGRALLPLIIGSQMIPVFALAPLLVLWFGYGVWPKAVVAALLTFFPITVNATDGLRSVSGDLVDLLRSMGAGEAKTLRWVRVPASLPFVFSGLKIGVTLSLAGATIGEWIGAERGLGYLMIQANALLRVDLMFAAVLGLTLIGAALLGGVVLLERRVLRWRRGRAPMYTRPQVLQ